MNISTSQLKKETHHKKVKCAWHKFTGGVKIWETDKFYFNWNSKMQMYSMPLFMIGKGESVKYGNKHFAHHTENGTLHIKVEE